MNLYNQRFGRWLVIGYCPKKPNQQQRWFCRCRCGTVKSVYQFTLIQGKSVSCGCYQREIVSRVQHGASKTKLYMRWKEMRSRCQNPNNHWYSYYGGRGITVSERWNSFENFYNDMGDPPFEGATIERVNNDEGYSKSNCVWATRLEQIHNRRQKK